MNQVKKFRVHVLLQRAWLYTTVRQTFQLLTSSAEPWETKRDQVTASSLPLLDFVQFLYL